MTPKEKARQALNGIIRAAEHNGRDADETMADAIRVQTAGLTEDELRGLITGLAGFVASAIQHAKGQAA